MVTVTASSNTISIKGGLTIDNAGVLKEQILQAIRTCQCAILDLSAVDDMDTAGFQLLAMVKTQAQAGGLKFAISAHSTASRRIIKLLMATDEFETAKGSNT